MVEGRNSVFTPKPCLFLSKLKFLDFNPGRSYKKELKYAVALLVILRKLAFSLISHPHHDLTHQRTTCDWTSVYAEVLKLLIFEAGFISGFRTNASNRSTAYRMGLCHSWIINACVAMET